MFSKRRSSATATPPPAPATLAPFVDDLDDYVAVLSREARRRYDHIAAIPRSELSDGPARWELMRLALLGGFYDAYCGGGTWWLIVPPSEQQACFPRTTPALWEYAYSHGTPLVYD